MWAFIWGKRYLTGGVRSVKQDFRCLHSSDPDITSAAEGTCQRREMLFSREMTPLSALIKWVIFKEDVNSGVISLR